MVKRVVFEWPQTWGTESKFSIVCKDCVKVGKKNALTTGYKNFQSFTLAREILNFKFLALAAFNLP